LAPASQRALDDSQEVTVDDSGAIDWSVRDRVYAFVVEQGRPPAIPEVAARLGMNPDAVKAAYQRLHARHALFLNPGTDQIRMIHPFSGVPTAFRVTACNRQYWANCAWDALGIPAALHADARIDAETGDDRDPLQITVESGSLRGWDGVVHFPVPFRHWYDDLIHT
jgi:Alkylmercury lyase